MRRTLKPATVMRRKVSAALEHLWRVANELEVEAAKGSPRNLPQEFVRGMARGYRDGASEILRRLR